MLKQYERVIRYWSFGAFLLIMIGAVLQLFSPSPDGQLKGMVVSMAGLIILANGQVGFYLAALLKQHLRHHSSQNTDQVSQSS